jgi:hypothetical protein
MVKNQVGGEGDLAPGRTLHSTIGLSPELRTDIARCRKNKSSVAGTELCF